MGVFDTGPGSYDGTTAAYENGDGTGTTTRPDTSLTYAWVIIVGALVALWLLGGVAFRTIRM